MQGAPSVNSLGAYYDDNALTDSSTHTSASHLRGGVPAGAAMAYLTQKIIITLHHHTSITLHHYMQDTPSVSPLGAYYDDDALPDSSTHASTSHLRGGVPGAGAMAYGSEEEDAEMQDEEEWCEGQAVVGEQESSQQHGVGGGKSTATEATTAAQRSTAPQHSTAATTARANPLRVASPLLPVLLGGWDGMEGCPPLQQQQSQKQRWLQQKQGCLQATTLLLLLQHTRQLLRAVLI